jgi:hypothetical protein
MLHLKEVVRGPLNVFAYLMTVRRTVQKRPKNKACPMCLGERSFAVVPVF